MQVLESNQSIYADVETDMISVEVQLPKAVLDAMGQHLDRKRGLDFDTAIAGFIALGLMQESSCDRALNKIYLKAKFPNLNR